ncbi:MAG: hypothetical protein IT484_08145 [Gammaproteobacteria bacterium]|nr:hypothetical protein [Gammaproteobacteria bacterium]
MDARPHAERWYRQPIIWLGALILTASLAGCLLLIVLGERYADEPLPVEGHVFRMPLGGAAAPPPGPAR